MTSLPKLIFAASTALVLTGCCCCPCNCGGGSGGNYSSGGGGGGGGGFFEDMVEDLASSFLEAMIVEGIEAALGREIGGTVELDTETGSLSFVTDEGERVAVQTENAPWPDGFPHVDRYPGSNVAITLDASTTDADLVAVVVETSDTASDVATFYETKMSTLNNYERADEGDTIVLKGEMPDGKLVAIAVGKQDGGGTMITFVAVPPNDSAEGATP